MKEGTNQIDNSQFSRRLVVERLTALILILAVLFTSCDAALAYAFNMVVADVRQPLSVSGGSACPVRAHQLTAAGNIALRWSTALGSNPVTILTQTQDPAAQLSEIEQSISTSLATWTAVSGTSLQPASVAPPTRVASAASCGADGVNSLCFAQPDLAFTPGVLAFTRVVTADRIGEQLGAGEIAVAPGQILDADIYFNPGDSNTTFATPGAFGAHPKSYDLQSILTHELGHFLGFSHSAIWGAMMFPYAHMPGTFATPRPNAQQPDAPLADDDRTGLRVLYPDLSDLAHTGNIAGRVLPANPVSLPVSPPGVTGIFGAQVVAVDSASGSVIASRIGGWSCADPGPV
ncbi:MAG TPA: matrixin family metalloprotease, partial [Verrucomicrobiae bacterium]|nr:matrixin family metalloprotease [Verrucomicrobiae bacterium]